MTDRRRRTLYPEIEPHDHGMLKVSGGHQVYYEVSGNPAGKPVVFVHGGPGGGSRPVYRRLFDPGAWRIVLFDQRGCGRSTPHAALDDNTTWDLVADMERLRAHLGVERWMVFGGSWGSTLGLAYAESHPERVGELVLRGIFMLRPKELLWFYQSGACMLYPDAWEGFVAPIPEAERDDLMAAYHRRLTGVDGPARLAAAKAWSTWEAATSSLHPDAERIAGAGDDAFAVAFARIECHYFVNGGFFEDEDQFAAGHRPHPRHPRRHRPGALRRGLPHDHRLGPAPGLAQGGPPRRPRRRPRLLRARHPARIDRGDGPVPGVGPPLPRRLAY